MASDLSWFFKEQDHSLACSSCGLTMKQSEQLSHIEQVISLLYLIHIKSSQPNSETQIRFIVEQAMGLLGEPITLTNN